MNSATHPAGTRTAEQPTNAGLVLRYATVKSVDLALAKCVVQIDEGQETQPVKWLEPRAGATRSWSPPSVGEQVVLLCPDGELAAATALRGIPCDAFPPAGNSVEERLIFDDGAQISYNPETHALEATLPGGSQATITADTLRIVGDVEITGALEVGETINAADTITSDTNVIADGISVNSHTHTGVSSGTSATGGPQ